MLAPVIRITTSSSHHAHSRFYNPELIQLSAPAVRVHIDAFILYITH
jgi:hypothetical protein